MTEEQLSVKIQNIKTILHSIEPYQITILTGSNGSGKSLIRQQLKFHLAKKLNISPAGLTIDVSMAKRTGSNPSLGGLSSFMHDNPTDPTSLSTYNHICTMIASAEKAEHKIYFIIDEPEIGMSKESLLGLTNYLKSKIPYIQNETYGMLIITHSEFLVNEFKEHANFKNMDGFQTAEEWTNRSIRPTDFKKLAEDSLALFRKLS